ncbi:hypothetical protein LCGC14_3076540, partial [marine sediment metagenome]
TLTLVSEDKKRGKKYVASVKSYQEGEANG